VALQSLEKVYKHLNPNYPSFILPDEQYGKLYKSEQTVNKLSYAFALISHCYILPGLLDCYVFSRARRKEWDRKILGATSVNLVSKFSIDFLRLVFSRWSLPYPYRGGRWRYGLKFCLPDRLAWWSLHRQVWSPCSFRCSPFPHKQWRRSWKSGWVLRTDKLMITISQTSIHWNHDKSAFKNPIFVWNPDLPCYLSFSQIKDILTPAYAETASAGRPDLAAYWNESKLNS